MNFILALCLATCATVVAGQVMVTQTTTREQVPIQWTTHTTSQQTSHPVGKITIQVNGGGSTSQGMIGTGTTTTTSTGTFGGTSTGTFGGTNTGAVGGTGTNIGTVGTTTSTGTVNGGNGNSVGVETNAGGQTSGGDGQGQTENTGTNSEGGVCIKLHGRCNAVAAANPFSKAQCCQGLHCQLSIFEGILWPTFACTNIKHKLGIA